MGHSKGGKGYRHKNTWWGRDWNNNNSNNDASYNPSSSNEKTGFFSNMLGFGASSAQTGGIRERLDKYEASQQKKKMTKLMRKTFEKALIGDGKGRKRKHDSDSDSDSSDDDDRGSSFTGSLLSFLKKRD